VIYLAKLYQIYTLAQVRTVVMAGDEGISRSRWGLMSWRGNVRWPVWHCLVRQEFYMDRLNVCQNQMCFCNIMRSSLSNFAWK